MRAAVNALVVVLGILVVLGSISWSVVAGWWTVVVLNILGPQSWWPFWAIAFDILLISHSILGIRAFDLIPLRSKAAVTASFIAAGFALVSLIPGYFFWVDFPDFNLGIALVPAIFFGVIYSAIGLFAYKKLPLY